MNEVIIQSSTNVFQLLKQQTEKELKRFSDLDQQVEKSTQLIKDAPNGHEALKQAMKLSYLVLNYRATLISSLNNIRDTYSSFDEQAKAILKKQEQNIQQRLTNVAEIHSSLELIQRLSYANRIQ